MNPARPGVLRALPAGVRVLGSGSMFMDISSELIHSRLPVFMLTALGASMASIGIVEGAAPNRINRHSLPIAGLAALIVADAILAIDGSPLHAFVGAAL